MALSPTTLIISFSPATCGQGISKYLACGFTAGLDLIRRMGRGIPYRLVPTPPVLSIVEGMAGVIISFRHCEAVEDGRGNLSLSFRPERSAVEKSK